MKIVAINQCDFGSTGFIARSVLEECARRGHECHLAVFHQTGLYANTFSLRTNKLDVFCNRCLCRLDGSDGFHNKKATRRLIEFLSQIKPDIIFLNNVHGRYLCLELLFSYAKNNAVKVLWTLHDCWAFTGRCAHYQIAHCERWKTGCGQCPTRNEYPAAYLIDGSRRQLAKKIELYHRMDGLLSMACPSLWIQQQLSHSLARFVPSFYVPNGVRAGTLFGEETIRTKKKDLSVENKLVTLFVTSGYSERKGIRFINRLADELNGEQYAFLVVGLKPGEHKKCSKNIVDIGYVKSREEMDLLYNVADVYLNPSLEDTFPLTALEAMSCGTPTVAFNSCGIPETQSVDTGVVVPSGDYDAFKQALVSFDKKSFSADKIRERAQSFSVDNMVVTYALLLERLCQSSFDKDER